MCRRSLLPVCGCLPQVVNAYHNPSEVCLRRIVVCVPIFVVASALSDHSLPLWDDSSSSAACVRQVAQRMADAPAAAVSSDGGEAGALLAQKGLLVLDCDSTLCAIEGIDELARARSPATHAAVARMTAAAMAGGRALEDVYAERLALIRPGRAAVAALAQQYLASVEPSAAALVARAHALRWRVAVVSGGLDAAIRPVAAALGVDDVVAVPAAWREGSDDFAGVDTQAPTARAGGKIVAIRQLLRGMGACGARRAGGAVDVDTNAGDEVQPQQGLPLPVLVVGDGMSDAETLPDVTVFVGYGGVVARPAVQAAAAAAANGRWVTSLAEVAPVLEELSTRATAAGPSWELAPTMSESSRVSPQSLQLT